MLSLQLQNHFGDQTSDYSWLLKPTRVRTGHRHHCKSLMLQWAKTLQAKRISLGRSTESYRNWRWFLRDGLWHGYPSRYKHVWTTWTGFWQDVAGKFRPPVPPLRIPSLPSLTMKLAVHLAKEVAAILRAVLTHETKKLYNDSTVHLLCSNYWIQPICQELLHSSSRYNATREGERKRPSSGLAQVAAYPKPPKQRKPSASGTSFSDWIRGTCFADTLQVWFPARWAPVVLQQLQQKEDNYRAENPSWMDQEEAPADILKQWQEARANRRLQFKVGNYRDGSWESNIRMLTDTIEVDWIQLPVEPYLAALPTLQQGVIGVFRQKGAAPWVIPRAEKLQLSVLLPNDLSLEDWYAGVYGLPTVWPEASMLGADNLRKVAGYDFHLLRKKYDVRTMWGDLDPQRREDLAGTHLLSSRNDFSQISPSGQVMTRKRLCVLTVIL